MRGRGEVEGGPAHLDTRLSVESRVADLVSRLTLDEKVSLLGETAPAIPRLGIAEYYHGNEALHGVVRPGTATVFPQAIALAASWNPQLVERVAAAISDEARAKHNAAGGRMQGRFGGLLTFWSPVVNMARDPRWGRTAETYGEDPHLTARIGVAFVRGLQGDDACYLKVVSTPKHFAANNEEHNRFECDARISERALREYYLPAFRACVVDGKAQSIMGAYNAINGVPCCANRKLLTDILRREWGFTGYVVTDCGAVSHLVDKHRFARGPVEAAALAVNAGVDLECGTFCTTPQVLQTHLAEAVEKGLVSLDVLDRAVGRVLRARVLLGMFDPPERVPFSTIALDVVGSKKHMRLALRVARESIVLLKNDGKLLPLDRRRIKSIAVLGPNAAVCQFGDYSGTPANAPVTPLEGIRRKLAAATIVHHVPWETGPARAPAPVPSRVLCPTVGCGGEGLLGQYFGNLELGGKPAAIRVDAQVDFDWSAQAPDSGIPGEAFSACWRGMLTPPQHGSYRLAVEARGGVRLSVDGSVRIDRWDDAGALAAQADFTFSEGLAHEVLLEYRANAGSPMARFLWLPPADDRPISIAPHTKAARESDVVVAVLGLNTMVEAESKDRKDLLLPAAQRQFIRRIVKANANTVVVLVNGGPLAVTWIERHVPAVVEAWYPGEQGGNAIADVLFGAYNPGGRLPVTFPRSLRQLPPFDDYEPSRGRTYMYLRSARLYPFGHGLSYTRFAYNGLRVDRRVAGPNGRFNVSVRVRNAGGTNGDEVAQLYVRAVRPRVPQPLKKLCGFKRVHLKVGESKRVSWALPVAELAYYDEQAGAFRVEPGRFELMVGASSADIRRTVTIEVR